jgi:hypothetical protein
MLDQALTVTTQQTVEATAAPAITTQAKVLKAVIQLTPEIMPAGNAALYA